MPTVQKHFVLGCLLFACMRQVPMGAQEKAKSASHLVILGRGQGVDHVGIAVRDIEAAKKTYRDILGFTVVRGGNASNGTRNKLIWLQTGMLEIITSWDRTKAEGGVVASFIERHEGGLFLGLEATPVNETAKLLRSRGFDIRGPKTESLLDDPEQHDRAPSSWSRAGVATGAVPAGRLPTKSTDAIFFVQYDPFDETVHPNTSKKLVSVWMGVRDLEGSIKAYESIGFPRGRKLVLPQLGAKGQEIEAGQGSILLLQPENTMGKVASFLAERGAEGVMGVSIEVASLQTARSLLEANTNRQFEPYAGPYGQSVLIPPEFTRGIWIEFFQK